MAKSCEKITGKENRRFELWTRFARKVRDRLLFGGCLLLFTWACWCGWTADLDELKHLATCWPSSPVSGVSSGSFEVEEWWSRERRRIQAAAVAAIHKIKPSIKGLWKLKKIGGNWMTCSRSWSTISGLSKQTARASAKLVWPLIDRLLVR